MSRIVLLTQYFAPEMGAPQTRLRELAHGLQQRGWEVQVVTAMPNYPQGKIAPGYKGKWHVSETIDGITVHRYWLYASNAASAMPRILSMLSFSFSALFSLLVLWRFRPRYLFVESPPLTLGFTGWLLSLLSGARFVFNISDIWPLTAKELGAISDGVFYRFLEKTERFLYRRAALCTGQSDEIIQHIQENGGRKVLIFRNGVNLARFPEPAIAQNKPPVRLVYTGLLGVAQGIVQICKNIPFKALGIEFHIYGSGAELAQLEAWMADNPDSGIVYHGIITSDKIPATVVQYDAALIALARHIPGAVPSKIYEAMAAGLPIVFSGDGEGARLILRYQVGWVCPSGDFTALKNCLAALPADFELRQKYAQNARATAAGHFSREVQIERLAKTLPELP